MGPLDSLMHVLNFLAPAAGVALLTTLGARIFMKKGPFTPSVPAQATINFIVGTALLCVGLASFGHDGKMATYAALVVGVATSQLWLLRGQGRARR
ncbi:hypothetical protein RD110_21350 [Rhodoferax koreense]|uniref:Uncharacterized protein n=2 Tax=Rhodoferax koreensis TaxID=1842727 RepID=A0A1P8K0B9_9BURK|nr:hypothetical protein [Rhodoferax koreense]APW39447.1 hypothetical protein RD110_21350 [Rhodoferax koreense]